MSIFFIPLSLTKKIIASKKAIVNRGKSVSLILENGII